MDRYPISYSPDMIRARREGRKRMTRRIIRPQPFQNIPILEPEGWGFVSYSADAAGDPTVEHWNPLHCPYGKPGDTLWIREEHRIVSLKDEWAVVQYRADETVSAPIRLTAADLERLRERTTPLDRWMQARFMLRSFCRSFDRVTAVRVERLQDINGQDAISEGIEPFTSVLGGSSITTFRDYATGGMDRAARQSFMTLWESINGPDSWKANPWVWVVSFDPIIL